MRQRLGSLAPRTLWCDVAPEKRRPSRARSNVILPARLRACRWIFGRPIAPLRIPTAALLPKVLRLSESTSPSGPFGARWLEESRPHSIPAPTDKGTPVARPVRKAGGLALRPPRPPKQGHPAATSRNTCQWRHRSCGTQPSPPWPHWHSRPPAAATVRPQHRVPARHRARW